MTSKIKFRKLSISLGLFLCVAAAMAAAFGLILARPAHAQPGGQSVPYWASLTVDEANSRVGPGEDYRILWIYKRKQLPLKVIRVIDGWRLIEDPDGAQGWMLARFLSTARTAYVRGEEAPMRAKPDGSSRLLWRAAPGVVGKLGACDNGWCQFDVHGQIGWVEAGNLWGQGKP